MDWTRGGLDEAVSFTESYSLFKKSQYDHHKESFNPATDLPESKLHRVYEWECQAADATATATAETCTSTQYIPRHPCEVVAEHWDEVFDRYRFASHLFDFDIGLVSNSSTCDLCKLFAQAPMMNDMEWLRPSHVAVYAVNLLGERERRAAEDYAPEHYVMGLTLSVGRHQRPEKHLKGLSRRNHRHGTQGLIVPAIRQGDEGAKGENRSPYIARVIDPKQTDFSLLQQWISKCQSNHAACQQPQQSLDQLGVNLTVVDCESKSKVLLPQGERYLALSYRWGEPPDCDDPWAVSAAPRTVRDAMALALRLGFRYLWVDRHCIDQENGANKARDLAIMDHIYENATLTIVAMAGNDDTYGLPGIGTEPVVLRNEPSQAILAGHTLVSLNPDILTSVRESEWSTRAWTFQETLLSRRCLLFTPDQVYFICRTTYWSEFLPNFPNIKLDEGDGEVSEYDPYSGSDPEVSLANLFYFETGGLETAQSELAQFQRDVNIYLKRVMGDQNDGLNAFRGILSRSTYWSYYGVPLITRAGRGLSMTIDPTKDYENLPTLPRTISNGVRVVVDKYTRDRRMEQMIAVTALTTSKQRQRKTIFGSTYYDNYTYDCLPGPGEPFHPSPVMAFLHGLGWTVDPGTICSRRPPMPTWSWVSVFGGAVSFDCDPDGTKELPTDVWTIPKSDVKVWLPLDKGLPSPEWTEFDMAFQSSPTKVIAEHSPLIKIESRVGDIRSVTFQPWEGETTYNFNKVFVSIADQVDAAAPPYEIYIDCPAELPHHAPDKETSWDSLNWKFLLVSRTSIYNADPKWRHMWEGWQPTNVFLVIRPFGDVWKRVGLLKTKDRLYQNAKRETMVIA
ncbi:heterokaryon incompatibility protein-domain-containing protein [Xylaria cf. heliscus]|nr:heterokaryon incompatibility protein-domain-containing protein [Xylaria cf. heliscus]